MDGVRIDQWLNAARIYKSRTLASQACSGGHVKINGKTMRRPSHPIRVGDEVRAQAPRGVVVLKVLNTADKRLSPALARQLYEDHSPPPLEDERRPLAVRKPGSGRPSKSERRALDRFRAR